jgi:ATP-dependent DNA helicase RecQ
MEMATYYPMSSASLAKIHGVGAVKLEHYGAAFLEPIRAYCAHRGLAERDKVSPAKRSRSAAPASPSASVPRQVAVGDAYNAGKTVAQLAESYGVQASTIIDHLANYALEGRSLRAGNDLRALSGLPADRQEAVLAAFDAEGADRLRPVFDRLNGQVSFEEIKILRVVYLSQGF